MTGTSVTSVPTLVRVRRAAIELFARQGFAGTGIRELADAAGITTATLYHHVTSKDDLLDDIIDRSMRALIECGRHWLDFDGPPDRQLAGLVGSHVVFHASARDEVVVVDRQLDAMRATSRRRAIERRDDYESTWRTVIERGVAEGVFEVASPNLATLALLGCATSVADWYRPSGPMRPDAVAEAYVTMSLDLLNSRSTSSMPDLEPALAAFRNRWDTP